MTFRRAIVTIWLSVFRVIIGFLNYLIVYKAPIDHMVMRTDFVVGMAFLYDFLVTRKEHRGVVGKWINGTLIIIALFLCFTLLAGFVEPVSGNTDFPTEMINGQLFITSLPFRIPYNLIRNLTLVFALGVLFESLWLHFQRQDEKTQKAQSTTGQSSQLSPLSGLPEQAASKEDEEEEK